MLGDHPHRLDYLFGMGTIMINDLFVYMRAKKTAYVLPCLVQNDSIVHTRVRYIFPGSPKNGSFEKFNPFFGIRPSSELHVFAPSRPQLSQSLSCICPGGQRTWSVWFY